MKLKLPEISGFKIDFNPTKKKNKHPLKLNKEKELEKIKVNLNKNNRKFSLFKKYQKTKTLEKRIQRKKNKENCAKILRLEKKLTNDFIKLKKNKNKSLDKIRNKKIKTIGNPKVVNDHYKKEGLQFFKIKKKKIKEIDELFKIKKNFKFKLLQSKYTITKLLNKTSRSIMVMAYHKENKYLVVIKVVIKEKLKSSAQLTSFKVILIYC
jgi:hypothetical protein